MDTTGGNSTSSKGLGSLQDTVKESIIQGFQRLIHDGELTDVTVTVGTDEFRCHRSILAAVSEFFRALFRNENSSDRVTLKDNAVSPMSFALLVEMLYKKSDVVLDINTAIALSKMAVFLQIQFLQEHCEQYLVSTMTPNTCLLFWRLAEQYSLTILERGLKMMATTRFLEVSKSRAFDKLRLEHLLVLLSSEDLVVTKEDHVADGIIKWVTANKGERKKYLPVLLPFVTLINVSDSGIQSLRESCTYISHFYGYLEEALTFKLEGATRLNSVLRREILARQERRVSRADVDVVLTAIGHRDGSKTQTLVSVCDDSESAVKTDFPEMNEDWGDGFATCVWRNELYVSGGFNAPWSFKVYNLGTAKWSGLPRLPQGRYGHAMVAVSNNIFLHGGLPSKGLLNPSTEASPDQEKKEEDEKMRPLCEISVYFTASKYWKSFARLLLPVTDVTAAVIGHRIYVMGGCDADGRPSSLVQCVDTLTGLVYSAGRLPNPTSGARALSGGSTIYTVVPEGMVYQMNENSFLADQIEKQLLVSQQQTTYDSLKRVLAAFEEPRQGVSCENNREHNSCSDQPTLPQSLEKAELSSTLQDAVGKTGMTNEKHCEPDESNTAISREEPISGKRKGSTGSSPTPKKTKCDELSLETSDNHLCAVTFKRVAVISKRRHFGACLHKKKLLVAGGKETDGASISSVIEVNLHNGTVTVKPQKLEMSACSLYVMNVPKLSDKVEFRLTFRPEDIQNEGERVRSKDVKCGTETWFIEAEQENGSLAVYLFRNRQDAKRKWMVGARLEVWLVPARHIRRKFSPRKCKYIFKDSQNFGYGCSELIEMETLTDPDDGYINANGEVTIQATVTITEPPKLEPPEPEPEQQ